MEVTLLHYTPDPELAVATAARICYSSWDGKKLHSELTSEEINNLIDIIIKNKHFSTLEHAVFTFSISGVSRACTHQIVRHRLASYNQQSQRYVKFNENTLNVVIPNSITNDSEALKVFNEAIDSCKTAYIKLLNSDIPAEDARYVLPNACESNLIVTMNARELIHFFSLRCCNRSQWEIRELAWKMLTIVTEIAPRLFMCAGPACLTSGICSEGKMTCGNPYSKVKN